MKGADRGSVDTEKIIWRKHTHNSIQISHINKSMKAMWLQRDSNPQPLKSQLNTQPGCGFIHHGVFTLNVYVKS